MRWVNMVQSKEERRQKYWLAKSCGKNTAWCRVMRDWHLKALELRLGIAKEPRVILRPDGRLYKNIAQP